MKLDNLHLEHAVQFFKKYKISVVITFLTVFVIYQLIDLSEQETQFTLGQMESLPKLGDKTLRKEELESQRRLLAPYLTAHPSYLQLIILKAFLTKSIAKSGMTLKNKTEYLVAKTQLGYDISVKMMLNSSFQSVVNWIQSQFSNHYAQRVASISIIKDSKGALNVKLTMTFHYYLSTKL